MNNVMISSENPPDNNASRTVNYFLDKDAAGFYEWHDWFAEKGLERLVFRVSKNPKYLQAHLERIYYCFQEHLGEQLFGALVDLIAILGKDGVALAKRMIVGSKSRLTEAHYNELISHVINKGVGSDLLLLNRYSVFAKGLESSQIMVRLAEKSPDVAPDPLSLAQDYIEFNQLENATQVLEQAILNHPERMELHDELLSLYRSTRNQTGFNRTFIELSNEGSHLPTAWVQLRDFFNLSKHGN